MSVTATTSAGTGPVSSTTVDTIIPLPNTPVIQVNRQDNTLTWIVNTPLTCAETVRISFQPVQSFEDVVLMTYVLTDSSSTIDLPGNLNDDVAYDVSARVQSSRGVGESSTPIFLPPRE